MILVRRKPWVYQSIGPYVQSPLGKRPGTSSIGRGWKDQKSARSPRYHPSAGDDLGVCFSMRHEGHQTSCLALFYGSVVVQRERPLGLFKSSQRHFLLTISLTSRSTNGPVSLEVNARRAPRLSLSSLLMRVITSESGFRPPLSATRGFSEQRFPLQQQ